MKSEDVKKIMDTIEKIQWFSKESGKLQAQSDDMELRSCQLFATVVSILRENEEQTKKPEKEK